MNFSFVYQTEVLASGSISVNMQLRRVDATIEDLFRRLCYDKSDFPMGGIHSLASILA